MPASMLVMVPASARSTVFPPTVAGENTVARLDSTLDPAPARPPSASATSVAIWAAAFWAATLLLAMGS